MIHLEVPDKKHEEYFLEMIKEFVDNEEEIVPNAMIWREGEDFDKFLVRLQDASEGKNLKPGRPASSLFFAIDSEGKLVGGIHIRHELAGTLSLHGGHIGYGIRPSERRKGYSSEALKLALEEAKKLNIHPVMLTCNKNNIGSAKTIIKNGGELECEYERDEEIQLKWWIENA